MECRKSVRDLSPGEKTAYVNAVLALKTAPSLIPSAQTAVTAGGGTPNRYDDYVWMHNVIGGGAHRGPAFGPWHREFLRQFELDLRKVSGDPHISIPFWDWTVDRSPLDGGWPFTNDFMGGFGGSSPAFEVTTGPFSSTAAWRVSIRLAGDSTLRLKRRIGVPAATPLPLRATVLPAFTIGIYDVAPYHADPNGAGVTPAQRTAWANAAFRKYLEWLLHDGIHGWVGGVNAAQTDGGHMTFVPVAVNDPVFWLHHANVDRLWSIWQQRNPGLGYEPAAGANVGHNTTDVMIRFSDASHFNFPLANRPADVLDGRALGVWYRSDLPGVSPVALSVDFGNVPEGLTTHRPVQFQVRTCQPVKFRITAVSGANFSVPASQGTVVAQHSDVHDPVTANVYLQFEAVGPLSSAQAGMATIEAFVEDADGYFAASVNGEYVVGSWAINLTATPVPRPRSAIVLVLDRSGSMSESAGPAGTKYDLLKSSLQTISDIMDPTDALGIVSYDDLVTTLSPMTPLGSVSPPGPGRVAVSNAIASGDLDPRGATAIGDGMIAGASVLDAERLSAGTPYSRFAMLVMTDGNENWGTPVTSGAVAGAIAGFNNSVYAIGLGSENNVSAATLGEIARYMLITGDITTAEQRFRLTKYFAQIVAAVTNTAIIVDPQGDLHIGTEHRLPFLVTEADVGIDVIALSPAALFLDFSLEAPDGSPIDPASTSPNVEYWTGREDAYYRIGLPAIPGSSGTHAGEWTAILRVSKRGVGLSTHMVEASAAAVARQTTGTLPYSLLVQARSNIALQAFLGPASGAPGTMLHLNARLREYDVPIEGRAGVVVEVADPAGGSALVTLYEKGPGAFNGDYETSIPGVYVCRFKATGVTLSHHVFQREQTRTAAIFDAPLQPPFDPSIVSDILNENRERLCEALACLFGGGDALVKLLERLGFADPGGIAKCLQRYCRGAREGGSS